LIIEVNAGLLASEYATNAVASAVTAARFGSAWEIRGAGCDARTGPRPRAASDGRRDCSYARWNTIARRRRDYARELFGRGVSRPLS
jgi:hypothetical protein